MRPLIALANIRSSTDCSTALDRQRLLASPGLLDLRQANAVYDPNRQLSVAAECERGRCEVRTAPPRSVTPSIRDRTTRTTQRPCQSRSGRPPHPDAQPGNPPPCPATHPSTTGAGVYVISSDRGVLAGRWIPGQRQARRRRSGAVRVRWHRRDLVVDARVPISSKRSGRCAVAQASSASVNVVATRPRLTATSSWPISTRCQATSSGAHSQHSDQVRADLVLLI